MSRLFVLVILLCFLLYSEQKSTPQDDHYVAAVVEYAVRGNVNINMQNYVQFTREASEQNADIIVFPEMTLTQGNRTVTVPILGILKEYPVPADRPDLYDEILVSISEAAKQNNIYVVINLQEKLDCNDAPGEYCPENKVYLFNTNVVFDRKGAVIDRYRKINLFGEFTRTPALKPDLGVFSTDFGVTFGHYICFDLMFQVPAIQVVEKHNLTDIVFSTMWFSEMPYLTAVEIQEAYSYAMNVNFLAAGANNVRVGSAGSGIYSGKAGALISIMPGLMTTRMLVAKVPKTPGKVTETYPGPIYDNPSDHDNLLLKADPSLPSHVSRSIVSGFQEFTLVDKEVSCRFRIKLNQRNGVNPYYRAFIQDGSNTYAHRQIGVAACAVVACQNDDVKTCPHRFNKEEQNGEFEELEIEMRSYRRHYNTSLQCDDIIYFPSTLTNIKFPLNVENFTFVDNTQTADIFENDIDAKQNRENENILLKLNKPQNQIISFGIWGRVYSKDVDHTRVVTAADIEAYRDIEDVIYGTKRKTNTNI